VLLERQFKGIRIKQQNELSSKNLYLFKSITTYVQNSNLRKIEKEEILQQIMDMMLEAQSKNKDMNAIIGNDYEEFCQSIIVEYESNKNNIYKVASFIQRYLFTLFIVSLIMWIIGGDISNYLVDFEFTLDNFIMANIVALILVPASKKKNQETSSMSSFASFWQRIQMRGKGKNWTVSILLMLAIMIFKESILKKAIEPMYFIKPISLIVLIPSGVTIILILVAIEIYKRKYDKI
jgi:DNA-binding ferritin-like protein (Dps family)